MDKQRTHTLYIILFILVFFVIPTVEMYSQTTETEDISLSSIINLPLATSYSIPFDSVSSITPISFTPNAVDAALRRWDIDILAQFLVGIGPVFSVGLETGGSLSIPTAYLAGTLGHFFGAPWWFNGASPDAELRTQTPSPFGRLAVHVPLRLLLNFAISSLFGIDIYSGINLDFPALRSIFSLTVDVGTRLYIDNFFLEVSYAVPLNIHLLSDDDNSSLFSSIGLWSNALTLGLGYRFNISNSPL